jgi:cyclic pyranopterin phosphate synthase
LIQSDSETGEFNQDSDHSHEADGFLRDKFGRPMKSLRVSVTDRCNLACTYCMPKEGPDEFADKEKILTYEELTRLVRIFVEMGVDNVRLTGGEPLLRNELYKLVRMLDEIDGLKEVTLTTNGYYLVEQIDDLVEAGLDRINFSLDTLRKNRFREISRRQGFDQVMNGLQALLNTPSLRPHKLNVVAIRGFNDDEVPNFAEWAVEQDAHVRFIEFMPLEKGKNWSHEKVILADELKERAQHKFDLTPVDDDPHAPSTTYRIDGTDGHLGFIPSVSNPFCETCDRIRITADGQVKNCLFAYDEDDLRNTLRSNAGRDAIKKIIRDNYESKWEGGCSKLAKGEYDPEKISRIMSRVGG